MEVLQKVQFNTLSVVFLVMLNLKVRNKVYTDDNVNVFQCIFSSQVYTAMIRDWYVKVILRPTCLMSPLILIVKN